MHAPARENQLPFPLDQRFVVAGWKLLFLRHGSFAPDRSKSAEWNRGAYLVEGLAHCGACHTPRNGLGAERPNAAFAGGDVDNWQAYAINAQSPAPIPWTAEALYAYLRQGWQPDHGTARGPMAEVVSNLSSVNESDVRAIATYMAGVFGAPTPDRKQQGEAVWRRPNRRQLQGCRQPAIAAGAAIYAAACATCHETGSALPYGGLQSRALHRSEQSRSPQRRQHRLVGRSPGGGRTQPDHAGLCRQHERRPGHGAVAIPARPLQQPTAMDRR